MMAAPHIIGGGRKEPISLFRPCALSLCRLAAGGAIAFAIAANPVAAANGDVGHPTVRVDPPPGFYRPDGPPEILDGLQDMFENSAAGGDHFCAIVITQNGRLRPNIENTELSSKQIGGAPGIAQVTATRSSYNISIDQTIGFTNAPANGASNTTFSATYSANGATNFSEMPGNIPVKLKKGVTDVEANFIAVRSPDAFPAGNYAGELILRCE